MAREARHVTREVRRLVRVNRRLTGVLARIISLPTSHGGVMDCLTG